MKVALAGSGGAPLNRPTTDIDIVSPDAFHDETGIQKKLKALRREKPVVWIDQEPYRPFFALLKHADVMNVERLNKIFVNEPRLTLVPKDIEQKTIEMFGKRTGFVRLIIDMDEPDHRKYRQITQAWFNGPTLDKLRGRMAALAKDYVDRMEAMGGSCDFAADIAVPYPLVMITAILGLPDEDAGLILRLTQELFGAQDPDRQRSGDYGLETVQEFFAYLGEVVKERRKNPKDDLMSVIANAQIDGEPISDFDALSYGMLLATAGHDTTSSSVGVGMLELARRPDQLEILKRDPDAVARTASDEMFRWATPVRHFLRTATEDFEIRGVTIPKGEAVCLIYPSANRDEDAFEAPDEFRVTRSPNRHLGFGFGVHHCLGRVLAEMEVEAFYRELGRRIDKVRVAGGQEWVKTNLVGGLKKLPIDYSFV